MSQATSYNITSVQGAHDQLLDTLRAVSPEQTPLFATLPHSTAPKATFVEWLNDDLPNPAFDSPLVDGADLSFNTDFTNEIANRVRLGNKIQQFQRQGAVSPIADAIDVAGPGSSLLAQSKARILTTLKTDIESAIGSSQVSADGSSSAGSKMGGLFHFSDPDASTGVFDTTAKQAYRAIGNGVTHDGTGESSRFDSSSNTLTEGKFRKVLESIFVGGGKSQTYRMFAGPTLMNTMTDFSRALNVVGGTQARFNANIKDKTLTLSVVEVVTDMGIIQIVPDLFLNRTSGSAVTTASKRAGIILPTDDTTSIKQLAPLSVQDLPDVGGGGDRFLTRAILTLCVTNSRAIGSII